MIPRPQSIRGRGMKNKCWQFNRKSTERQLDRLYRKDKTR